MPSVSSAKKSKPGALPSFDDFDSLVAEHDNKGTTKKKGRNGAARQSYVVEESADAEVARERSQSPSRPLSILGQTSRAFGRKEPSLDVLDTLGTSQKVSDQQPFATSEWAQEVPYGKSPPGDSRPGRNLSGSPPTTTVHLGRGGFSTRSPPVSPPQRVARPVSYGGAIPPLPYRQSLGEHPYRHSPSVYGSPPAPHLPQPHFYAANDVDLGLGYGPPRTMPSEASFIGFSHLCFSETSPSKAAQPVILIGSDSRLDVLVSLGNKIELLGALYDLPGMVVNAKLLTWNSGIDPFSEYRPLVAVVLHGLRSSTDGHGAVDEATPSVLADGRTVENSAACWPEYQTRVEVYSLARKRSICTLLTLPPIAMESDFRRQPRQIPDPSGDLKIDVHGNFLTVSSGISGEVYVFAVSKMALHPGFECIAKFWTSVQTKSHRRDSSHGRSVDADVSPADLNRRKPSNEASILSLSGRWLAIVPATSPARSTLDALLGPMVADRISSGRDLRNPPPRPAVTCEVDSPDADTLLSKAVREVAQGMARGARWFAEQGVQLWNNYSKKEQPPSLSPHAGYDPQLYSAQPTLQQFPPTHSAETQTNTREPDLVSIFDLKAIQKSSAKQKIDEPKPVATFQPPGGCSFLSFMPNGLGILTVSSKGDIQYIWDLMQIKHCRTAGAVVESISAETNASPRVRQVAKFPRLTTSTVVDVVWESAVGDRFALVTKNGTVHVFDLPLSAFRWPPPRGTKRARPTSAPVDISALDAPDEPLPAGGIFAQALNIAGKTQPMFANLRGRAPSLGSGYTGIGNTGIGLASATGVKGSRAVAAGLSKSLGAATGTVNQFRHAGENRLHLRSLANDPAPGRVAWDIRGSKAVICVLDKAAIRSYYMRKADARENSRQQRASVFDDRKAAGLKLPDLTALVNKALPKDEVLSFQGDEEPYEAVSGWSSSRLLHPTVRSSRISHPLSHAEIDTNTPYQPFHSDSRVTLFNFPDGQDLGESSFPTASVIFNPPKPSRAHTSPEQWVFGNVIPGRQIKTLSSGDALQGDSGSVIYRETTASSIKEGDPGDLADQIVSTTRRRKRKPEASQLGTSEDFDHEGFFEDDCDVLDFAGDRV